MRIILFIRSGLIIVLTVLLTGCFSDKPNELRFFEVETLTPIRIGLNQYELRGKVNNSNGENLYLGFLVDQFEENLNKKTSDNLFLDSMSGAFLNELNFRKSILINQDQNDYFYQAFAEDRINKRLVFGEVKSFSFSDLFSFFIVQPEAESIQNNSVNLKASINGFQKFSEEGLNHGFMIGKEGEDLEFDNENIILDTLGFINDDGIFESTIDSLDFNTPYKARAFLKSSDFFYSQNIVSFQIKDGWERKENAYSSLIKLRNGIAAVDEVNQIAYFGLGCSEDCNESRGLVNQLWSLQIQKSNGQDSLVIKKLRDFPVRFGLRQEGVAFIVEGNLYYGLGSILRSSAGRKYFKDFYQYNPNSNSWRQVKSFPVEKGRSGAVAFSIGNFGYVGSGEESFFALQDDFYQFIPPTTTNPSDSGEWKSIPPISGARSKAIGFVLDGKAYVGGGKIFNEDFVENTNSFMEFDPSNISQPWKEIEALGENINDARQDAVAFSLSNKGYVGTGFQIDGDTYLGDLWEYHPSSGWQQITNINLSGENRFLKDAVGFGLGGKGYIYGGSYKGGLLLLEETFNDLWIYTPKKEE